MTNRKEEAFSLALSRALDTVNFCSITCIKTEQQYSDLVNQKLNELAQTKRLLVHIVGSYREGMCNLDSDIDIMVSPMDSLFGDYKLRFSGSPPGYIQLQIFDQSEVNQNVFCTASKRTYVASISSSLANYVRTSRVAGPCIKYKSTFSAKDLGQSIFSPSQLRLGLPVVLAVRGGRRAGPSLEYQYEGGTWLTHMSIDYVLALPCKVPHYLHIWCNRRRSHDFFPTRNQIHSISKMDAHVVPIGCKTTDNATLDWRICYTMAEIALMRSFNATQCSVYAILKMLAKSVIKHVCSYVTSYVMKNVILWVSELFPLSMFVETNLSNCLVMCLHFLRQCIKNRYLPSYMIPDRDLLFGRLNNKRVRALTSLLGDIMSEGGRMVLRCERLKRHLYLLIKYPAQVESFATLNTCHLHLKFTTLHCKEITTLIEHFNELLNLLESDISTCHLRNYVCMITVIMKLIINPSSIRYLGQSIKERRDICQRLIRLERRIMDLILECCRLMHRHHYISKLVQNAQINGERNSDSIDRSTSLALDMIDSIYQSIGVDRVITVCRHWFEKCASSSETELYQILHRMCDIASRTHHIIINN